MDGRNLRKTKPSDRIWTRLIHPNWRRRRHGFAALLTVILAFVVVGFALAPISLPPRALPDNIIMQHLELQPAKMMSPASTDSSSLLGSLSKVWPLFEICILGLELFFWIQKMHL